MESCSFSLPMTRGGRISATRAAVFGLVAILASACASNARPAPISYGAARPPLAAAAAAAFVALVTGSVGGAVGQIV